MPSIYDWSKTADDNGAADSACPWPEGMARKIVNNSARGNMKRVAEFRDDISGALLAGGSANALTITPNSDFGSLDYGRIITFRASATNTGAATLNANGLGAKAIRKFGPAGEADVTAGDIQTNGFYTVMYSTAASGGSGAWLLMSQSQTTFPAGHLFGLTLSNNAGDATNDLDIAAGECRDGSNTADMVLASALTKRLDAAWAVGTNQGGRDTGSIANHWWHIWLIKRPDTGVVDVLFSASATAPTMPANYTLKRRIGAVLRDSGALVQFLQDGDTFLYNGGFGDRSSTSAQAATTLTMSVPDGIAVFPIFYQRMVQNGVGSATTSFANGNSSFATQHDLCVTKDAQEVAIMHVNGLFQTNTSAQLRYEVTIASGTLSSNLTQTRGYIDKRGRAY